MKSNGFLVDTNTISYLLENSLPKKSKELLISEITQGLKISVIVQIELLSWNTSNQLKDKLKHLLNISNIFPLDENVVRESASIRLNYKTKLPDAIIAATTIVNNFTLITRNSKDFSKINGLNLLNQFEN
jgi:hypothetical protein